MVSVDPRDGFYDGVTGVELDPDTNYEFRLVPFEADVVSSPEEYVVLQWTPETGMLVCFFTDAVPKMKCR